MKSKLIIRQITATISARIGEHCPLSSAGRAVKDTSVLGVRVDKCPPLSVFTREGIFNTSRNTKGKGFIVILSIHYNPLSQLPDI